MLEKSRPMIQQGSSGLPDDEHSDPTPLSLLLPKSDPVPRAKSLPRLQSPGSNASTPRTPLQRKMAYLKGGSVSVGLGWEDEDPGSQDSSTMKLEPLSENGGKEDSADWQHPVLPDRCVSLILAHVASLEDWMVLKSVSRQWARLARQALQALQVHSCSRKNALRLVDYLEGFPSLTSLQLTVTGINGICDTLLDRLGQACPQLHSLHISFKEVGPRKTGVSFAVVVSPSETCTPIDASVAGKEKAAGVKGSETTAAVGASSSPHQRAPMPQPRGGSSSGADLVRPSSLSLSNNLTEQGFDRLFRGCQCLQELTVATISHGPEPGADMYFQLPESLGDLSDLVALAIHSRACTGLPDTIGKLRALRELCVACENMQELPESLGQLSSLDALCLSGSRKLAKLPQALGNLSKLRTLDLQECQALPYLPSSLGSLHNLTALDCQNCQSLRELPGSICGLTNLTCLDLRGCISLEAIPESIGKLTGLTSLNLEDCMLKVVPDSIEELVHLNSPDMCSILGLTVPCFAAPHIR